MMTKIENILQQKLKPKEKITLWADQIKKVQGTDVLNCFIDCLNIFKDMPRIARLSIPGALHHVMARGIEGRSLFTEKEDRDYFLSLLSHGLTRSNFKCYAWVLMDNHYHLLFGRLSQPWAIGNTKFRS